MSELIIDLDADTSKMTREMRELVIGLRLALAGYTLCNRRGRYYLKQLRWK